MDCAKPQEYKNEFHTLPALKDYIFEEEKDNRHFGGFGGGVKFYCGKNT